MQLKGLLEGMGYEVLQGETTFNVTGIANDSRKIKEGSVFVAVKGYLQDGHIYIQQSINNGATAIVLEDMDYCLDEIPKSIAVIRVENGRKALALMSTHFYNHPSSQFKLVGVTGTNGKTTTVILINNILEHIGRKTGVVGTIYNKIGNRKVEADRTTPESIELKELFYEMASENVNDVIMEVSSHSLTLHRVDYTSYDVAVFTNLTLDHLDFHKTMENYRDAKLKLFKMAKVGVINIDDHYGPYMLEHGTCEKYLTYSIKDPKATLYASEIEIKLNGIHCKLHYDGKTYPLELQTPGEFSVYNAMAAIGSSLCLNTGIDDILEALKAQSRVKGRFEVVDTKAEFTAIVDYAHAPDGLENVLQSIEKFAKKRVITVFGCGGDRDRSKRPIMADIAGRYSDYTIITSDNPRTEDPEAIIAEIEEGIKDSGAAYETIIDRKAAIEKAIDLAQKDDLILVAGKGHENYQIIGRTKHHFDDVEVIQDYMKEKA